MSKSRFNKENLIKLPMREGWIFNNRWEVSVDQNWDSPLNPNSFKFTWKSKLFFNTEDFNFLRRPFPVPKNNFQYFFQGFLNCTQFRSFAEWTWKRPKPQMYLISKDAIKKVFWCHGHWTTYSTHKTFHLFSLPKVIFSEFFNLDTG